MIALVAIALLIGGLQIADRLRSQAAARETQLEFMQAQHDLDTALEQVLDLVALLFVPVVEAIPAFATAPALLIVGVMMMSSVRSIRWEDLTEAIPAFVTIFFIPLGFSIAEGLAAGLILYPFTKVASGRSAEIPLITWILAAVFITRFVFTAVRFG